MAASDEFKKELIGKLTDVRRFAQSLLRNKQECDDLIHDTIVEALKKADEFTPGTNMVAWLFTIERGIYNNARRRNMVKQAYLASTQDSIEEAELPEQFEYVLFQEAKEIIDSLPIDQKAALWLVCHDGRSYKEAADILDVNVGTVKSRVSRAKAEIARLLETDENLAARAAPERGM